MSENFWDRGGFVEPTDSFYKFNAIGDHIHGTIVALDKHVFDGDEHPTPKLLIKATAAITDGRDSLSDEDMEVTCGARNLKSLVMSKRPGIGDQIKISYVSKNGRTKVFEMEIAPGNSNPDAEPAEPAASPI